MGGEEREEEDTGWGWEGEGIGMITYLVCLLLDWKVRPKKKKN